MLIKTKYWRGILVTLMLISTQLWSSTVLLPDSNRENVANSVLTLEKAIKQLNGKGSPAAKGKAVQLLQTLADHGNAEAMLWLGRAYRDALDGTVRDLAKAFEYFEKAAGSEGKNNEAQYELGRAYFHGEGTDRNLIAAYMWTSLSLQAMTPVHVQAQAQHAQLKKTLSEAQLRSAEILVKQIRTLYLDK